MLKINHRGALEVDKSVHRDLIFQVVHVCHHCKMGKEIKLKIVLRLQLCETMGPSKREGLGCL